MNNNELRAQGAADIIDRLGDLLTRAIDLLPIREFDIDPDLARGMIEAADSIPALRDALHDAFMDNIPDFTA